LKIDSSSLLFKFGTMYKSIASLQALSFFARCVMGAASYPPIPKDLTTPVQQRLAVSSTNGIFIVLSSYVIMLSIAAMSVGWNTYQKIAKPCVQYGTSSTALTLQTCSDSSVTYPTSRTYSNAVVLAGLTPATTYYYKIVSTNSTVEHFFSPRVAGDTTPFSMNAVIDLGVYGADGYTIAQDNAKRDTIPQVDPSLNHTTINVRLSTHLYLPEC
jgi:hypothetical protein